MSSTKALKDSIEEALGKAAAIRFYRKRALPLAKPPYGVYFLDFVSSDGCVDVYELELFICDCATNDERIDELADQIMGYMDYLNYVDDRQGWHCYLNKRDDVEAADKSIQVQRLQFEVRYTRRM